ncbi:outer membrane protein assembly factor BamA [Winogradskyella wandonensis]|uniref:Outer membrane protein assembly factor BamA n=1 Tax=Winogradskyella wandonensis TaxID=1442586 RepID=A0A4R1KTR1_9FLAO|nr:POTRA domain-containing protein [Winogradskyella wandonensis]TCK68568.1 outer membrane protein assembly factor BamA [Winogradskyella wandonensis]
MKKKLWFVLIFGFFIFPYMYGQKVLLQIEAESELALKEIDSLDYKKLFSNYLELEKEVYTVKNKLIKKGFIDTAVREIKKQNDSLFNAYLHVGKKIKTVRVYLDSEFDKKLLEFSNTLVQSNYFEVSVENLEAVLELLNKRIAEQGDPFSTLQLINIKKEKSNLIAAELFTENNLKRQIDKIVVKGYERFPKSFIKRFLKLKKGQSFNLPEIQKRNEQLQNLRFAKEIKSPEVLFTNDSTTLYLYTEKTQSNNFDGYLGFGTNENTNRLEFDGYVDLRLVNNLNFGESLRLFYKSDEIDQQTFDIRLNAPYLFSSPIGLDIGLTIFRKDSTFSTTTQQLKLNYQVKPNHILSAGIKNSVSSDLLDSNSNLIDDFKSNYYQIGYNFIKPQYYDTLFPINFWLDISAGLGNRKQNGLETQQNTLSLEAYKIFNLNNKNSLFIRLTGAALTSDNYLDNELFRFGGINSIRGFEENSLVANLYGVINTEYRYRLSNTIYVHSVIDAAYFDNDINDVKNKLFGFGFGLGLLTKAGLFKLNYSSGKTENVPFKLSDSKIHVSLTSTF